MRFWLRQVPAGRSWNRPSVMEYVLAQHPLATVRIDGQEPRDHRRGGGRLRPRDRLLADDEPGVSTDRDIHHPLMLDTMQVAPAQVHAGRCRRYTANRATSRSSSAATVHWVLSPRDGAYSRTRRPLPSARLTSASSTMTCSDPDRATPRMPSDPVRPRLVAPLVDHSTGRILDAALVSAMRDRESLAIRRPVGSDA